MVIVPWQAVTLVSPLPPGEVRARLEARTEPPDARGQRQTPGKFLQGTVESRLFRVRPLGRRWSAVVARGEVRDDAAGSRIRLSVRPSLAGSLFMALMLGGLVAAVLAATVLSQRGGSVPPNILVVWILPVVGWLLLVSAMRRDGARMERVLGELLQGRVVRRARASG